MSKQLIDRELYTSQTEQFMKPCRKLRRKLRKLSCLSRREKTVIGLKARARLLLELYTVQTCANLAVDARRFKSGALRQYEMKYVRT